MTSPTQIKSWLGSLPAPAADLIVRLVQRVEQLERTSVSFPLQMNRGPSGTVISVASDAPPDLPPGDGLLADIVHVTARTFNQSPGSPNFDKWTYTCVKVDRGNLSNSLQESSPKVTYTGVFEAQNRIAVIDPPPVGSLPATVTHELPLYLDSKGRYFFQIDQYATGSALPDAAGGTTEFEFDGHVSTSDQVLGDGVKGFRRAARVNLSRNTADGIQYPRTIPAFTVQTDIDAVYQNGFRVFPHTFGGAAFSPGESTASLPAAGAAFGARNQEDLTGSFPLTVDGVVYARWVVFRGPGNPDTAGVAGGAGQFSFTDINGNPGIANTGSVGGWFDLAAFQPIGSGRWQYMLYVQDAGPNFVPNVTQPTTFGVFTPGGFAAYGISEVGEFYRGIDIAFLNIMMADGTAARVTVAGGLWVQVVLADGTIIDGVSHGPVHVGGASVDGNGSVGGAGGPNSVGTPSVGGPIPTGLAGVGVPGVGTDIPENSPF